jgi:hypothetical protein
MRFLHSLAAVLLLVLASCLVIPATVEAQTVVNPTKVQFITSADHTETVDTYQLVTSYRLEWVANGATAPALTANLGKPGTSGGEQVTVEFSTLPEIVASPINKGLFTARVVAVGEGGEGVSEPSNPFVLLGRPRPATQIQVAR